MGSSFWDLRFSLFGKVVVPALLFLILVLPAGHRAGHGRRAYLFEGQVVDARTKAPLPDTHFDAEAHWPSGGIDRPGDHHGQRGVWADTVYIDLPVLDSLNSGTRPDGQFRFFFAYGFSVSSWFGACRRSNADPPPSRFVLQASKDGYAPASVALGNDGARAWEPRSRYARRFSGIVIELRPLSEPEPEPEPSKPPRPFH